MKQKYVSGMLSGILFLGSFAMANATPLSNVVYSNDFEISVDSVWSDTNLATNSANGFASTQYHGDYTTTGSTTLTITGLGAHTQLALDFDLYLFNTWDGNNTSFGPDYFSLAGDIYESWTFTNHQSEGQSYPGTPDETYGTAGASQTQVYRDLGLTGSASGFLIAHTSSTFSITFGGPTTQSDEQWGIDNVIVSINDATAPPVDPPVGSVPEPATLLLFGTGLLGLAGGRLRKIKK